MSFFNLSKSFSGSTPLLQSVSKNSVCIPSLRAILFHKDAKCPVSTIKTKSSSLRIFTNAASHAPVPDAGKIITFESVLNIDFIPFKQSLVKFIKSGPR